MSMGSMSPLVRAQSRLDLDASADMPKDFRETAPAAASENMYTHDPRSSVIGGLASGVPGDVKGLEYLHAKHGVGVKSTSVDL